MSSISAYCSCYAQFSILSLYHIPTGCVLPVPCREPHQTFHFPACLPLYKPMYQWTERPTESGDIAILVYTRGCPCYARLRSLCSISHHTPYHTFDDVIDFCLLLELCTVQHPIPVPHPHWLCLACSPQAATPDFPFSSLPSAI